MNRPTVEKNHGYNVKSGSYNDAWYIKHNFVTISQIMMVFGEFFPLQFSATKYFSRHFLTFVGAGVEGELTGI